VNPLIALYSSSMQSGKSTAAMVLQKYLFARGMAFAEPFYDFAIDVAAPFIGSVEETKAWLKDERKDKGAIPGLSQAGGSPVTLRLMLQTIGTQWGRVCIDPNIWTKLAEKKALEALKTTGVVFDDMRFPNEFDMIKRHGGKTIRIVRPGPARGDTKTGEGLLDSHEFDFTVYNDNGLMDLEQKLLPIIRAIKFRNSQ
jgi:hypothetical protein